jgi:hypothetical protein
MMQETLTMQVTVCFQVRWAKGVELLSEWAAMRTKHTSL